MNFLSHFYCSAGQSDLTKIASLFPDVFPKFSYLHNTYFLQIDKRKLDSLELEILHGIEIHYADDKTFHSSDYFKHFNARIDEELKANEVTNPLHRKFLVSHILFELLIDHWIINQEPGIVSEVYQIAYDLDSEVLNRFLSKIIAKTEEINILLTAYEQFRSRRFLNFYAEESNLVKALHRVTGKISNWEYNEKTEDAFINIIQKIKQEIPYSTILDTVKSNRAS
jgi:hypothetical protein